MNNDWLTQLEDIVVPPAIDWWPLASSVWITLISLLGLLIGLIWYFRQRHKAAAYRREAQAQLHIIQTLDQGRFLVELNQLLKQVAITAYGRKACAGLDNQAWLNFLKQKAGFLEQPSALALLSQRYQNDQPIEQQQKAALIYYAKQWIAGHHL